MRASSIERPLIETDRKQQLRYEIARADREAAEYAFVGAWRAARHWRKRATSLRGRLDRL